jgi:benzoate transport
MTQDPRTTLATTALGSRQIAVIAIAVALNGLDGFDVLSISFASPGIAAEWGIGRAALGIVLPMEMVGMGLGSLLLGSVADRLGRRPLTLACLLIMSVGMFLASTARDLPTLCIWRVLTGLGIGGMLATTNALAAEFANDRQRTIAIAWTVVGYPLGAVILGWIASKLLATHDWRIVFEFGAAMTALMIPIVWFLVPESVHWLCRAQPPGALAKVNTALAKLGREPVPALPPLPSSNRKVSMAELFSSVLAATTIFVTLAYFLHISTFYFILKWVPKIVVDMGFAAPLAGKVLVWANVGGALGGALFGWLSARVGLRPLTIAVMLLGGGMVIVFGRGQTDLTHLAIVCAVAGFFTNAGIVGLYAMLARYFPTHVRATGTGFGIGVGRGGAALGPALAGFLFASGMGLQSVAIVMACGSFAAALTLLLYRGARDAVD